MQVGEIGGYSRASCQQQSGTIYFPAGYHHSGGRRGPGKYIYWRPSPVCFPGTASGGPNMQT